MQLTIVIASLINIYNPKLMRGGWEGGSGEGGSMFLKKSIIFTAEIIGSNISIRQVRVW